MRRFTDTIIAPFTGPGPAAVTGYRICGPNAWEVGVALGSGSPKVIEPMRAYVHSLITGETAVVIFYREGASYTGDETAEIFAHGSAATENRLLNAAIASGARMALPGEFTERAFLHGRMDLTAAEAVADLISSDHGAFLDLATAAHRGSIRDRVAELREIWLTVLAQVEATTDFSEEIGDFSYESARADLQPAKVILGELLEQAERAEIVRRGFRVAIVGRPNAGKSSLLNALLQRERAIVTSVPGTTRDVLEEAIEIGGHKVVFLDTAGLRATVDPVERIGIERTEQAVSEADLVLYVFDLEGGWSDEDQRVARRLRDALIVANKVDLVPGREVALGVSAVTGVGLSVLLDEIVRRIREQQPKLLLNDRHAALLRQFAANVGELEAALDAEVPSDLLATLLREGILILGRITGETAQPDMLDEIFRRFCIGK